jgi:hypothetical protein
MTRVPDVDFVRFFYPVRRAAYNIASNLYRLAFNFSTNAIIFFSTVRLFQEVPCHSSCG